MTDFESLKNLIDVLTTSHNLKGIGIVLEHIKSNVCHISSFSRLQWLLNQTDNKVLAASLLSCVIANQPEIIFLQPQALPMILNYLDDKLVAVLSVSLMRFKAIYAFLLSEQLWSDFNTVEGLDHNSVQGCQQILGLIHGGARLIKRAWDIAQVPDDDIRMRAVYLEAFEVGGLKTAQTTEGEIIYNKATLKSYLVNNTKALKPDERFNCARAAANITRAQ
jgi:hypothetical protein